MKKYQPGTFVRFHYKLAEGYGIVVESDDAQYENAVDILCWDYIKPYEELTDEEIESCDDYMFDDYLNCSNDEITEIVPSDLPEGAKLACLHQAEYEKSSVRIIKDWKQLLKGFCDELVSKDNLEALEFKGYSCYEGKDIYAQDWDESKRCLLKIFEKTCRPEIANSLGYIAYYGRCNNGVPQYDEAFRYFSIGAAAKLCESQYKLADMFYHGYSVPENKELAQEIYSDLYESAKKDFIAYPDMNNKFADLALRMCTVASEGEFPDWRGAYIYALEAKYAIGLRKKLNYYGDSSVEKAINEKIEQLKPYMKDEENRIEQPLLVLEELFAVGEAKDVVTMVSAAKDGKNCTLTFEPVYNNKTFQKAKTFGLLCIPEKDYCGLVKKYTISTDSLEKCKICSKKETFVFDEIFTDEEDGMEFYYNDELVASISAKCWTMDKPDKKFEYKKK